MNSVLLSIILVPIVEIYLFIKIGAKIGAFSTILLIFPLTRKLIFSNLSKKFNHKKKSNNDFIDGEYEDIEDDHDRKI